MTTDVFQSIIDYLKQEVEWAKALNDVLLKEKDALEKNKFEQLQSVAEAKQTLSENLENSSRKRLSLMQINPDNPKQHKAKLDDFLNTLPTDQASNLRNLIEALAHELTTCREQNNINGQVISTNLSTRKAIIDDLDISPNKSKDDNQATYDAQGGVKKNPRSGSYQEV